jgi:hypothetical protein
LLIKSGTVAYLEKWLLDVKILFGKGQVTKAFTLEGWFSTRKIGIGIWFLTWKLNI